MTLLYIQSWTHLHERSYLQPAMFLLLRLHSNKRCQCLQGQWRFDPTDYTIITQSKIGIFKKIYLFMGGMHIVYKQEVVRQPLVNSESRNLGFLGVLAAQTVCSNCTSCGPWQLRKWITTNVVTDSLHQGTTRRTSSHKTNIRKMRTCTDTLTGKCTMFIEGAKKRKKKTSKTVGLM